MRRWPSYVKSPSGATSELLWILGCGIAGLLLAWVVQGFQLVGPDQQLYVPFIRHAAFPALYPNDPIFDNANATGTLFVPLMGVILRWTRIDINTLQLVGQVVAVVFWFSGLAAVAHRLGGRWTAVWCVVFCSWALPVPGTACDLWATSFHPRTIAQALTLWALWLTLDGRAAPAGLVAAVAFLAHPLMTAPAIAGLTLAATAASPRATLKLLGATGAPILLSRVFWRGPTDDRRPPTRITPAIRPWPPQIGSRLRPAGRALE